MSFIISTFLRLIILIVCAIIEIFTIVNIIRDFSCKKLIFLFIPFLIVFTMFFQGNYKQPKLDVEKAICIAQNTISSKENKIPAGIYDNGQYNVILSSYESDDAYKELDDISNEYNKFFKLFAKKGFCDNIKYLITPMKSDRQSEGFYMHQGYRGSVFIAVNKELIIEIDYLIYRKADEILGAIYSPPVLNTIDFTQIITPENLVQKEDTTF
ncbi:MAG: hypothetical protein IJC37_01105 [Clostridia bacterium]|nr:hypothetical protein [Clostridia bacterium]MBQ4338004.1 hypothetical protein [Clostridia bacterium]